MHVHSAQTTLAKVEEALDKLLPPQGTRSRLGRTETYDDDLIDLRVHYLGGRDVLAVAVHADHDADPPTVVSEGLIHVEHYGPDHRRFETEGGAAMPPDSAGLIEDARRTWAMWFGQDGRPTVLWLQRGADGEVLGEPIDLTTAALADVLDHYADARRLRSDVVRVESSQVPYGAQYRKVYWIEPSDGDAVEPGVVAPARTVTIRRQSDGRDRFAFLDDDGHLVGEYVVDPRHVTLVHDREVPPEWSGVWPE